MPPRGPNKGAFAEISIGAALANERSAGTDISAIAVTGNMPDFTVQRTKVSNHIENKKRFIHPAASAIPTKTNDSNVVRSLTPIFVANLEDSLAGHPDPTLVSHYVQI